MNSFRPGTDVTPASGLSAVLCRKQFTALLSSSGTSRYNQMAMSVRQWRGDLAGCECHNH